MYFRLIKVNFPFIKGEGKRRKLSFPSTVDNFWYTFRSPQYSFIASYDAKNELKNENCNLRLSLLIVGRHFSNLIGKLFQLISSACNSSKLKKCQQMSKVQFFDRVDAKSGKQFTAYVFFFF